MVLSAELARQVEEDIAAFTHDPLGFVLYAFPWGEPGTELAGKTGPRPWQREVLIEIGKRLAAGAALEDAFREAVQIAVASGHGVGKSALVAWLILWSMSTHEDTRGVVTANTETQLRTKTWPEVTKWARLAINRHWFTVAATSIASTDPDHEKVWRFDAIPWSEHNTEAFAGLHNEGKRLVLIFDEASAIAAKVWEVAEGALTDAGTEIIWCAFGNPTRNDGRFRECFGRFKHRWKRWQIDARTVPGINLAQAQKLIDDYGEDSDIVRVRVRGMFPRASEMQFIPVDWVAQAMRREARSNLGDPLIMSMDVARGGDDHCVFWFRRGLDARTLRAVRIPGSEARDSMRLAAVAVSLVQQHQPDAFFFDGTGVGGPVGDRIHQLGYSVIEIQFGGTSPDPKYANMRAYMWAKMREALKGGVAIPDDPDLETQLTGPQYKHDRQDRLLLESKEDMKKRGLASPDDADSLAMTYAYPVMPRDSEGANSWVGQAQTDYDRYGDE